MTATSPPYEEKDFRLSRTVRGPWLIYDDSSPLTAWDIREVRYSPESSVILQGIALYVRPAGPGAMILTPFRLLITADREDKLAAEPLWMHLRAEKYGIPGQYRVLCSPLPHPIGVPPEHECLITLSPEKVRGRASSSGMVAVEVFFEERPPFSAALQEKVRELV